MAENKYHPGLPAPVLAHEMWSREICDRLDEVIKLLKAQTSTLVGDRAKGVQVEITEPDEKKPEQAKPAPAKPAPVRAAATPAKASATSSTAKK